LRIVIDLQACQTPGSRRRGIGRYSMALAQAMTRQAADKHEIWLALNGCFPDTIGDIREAFRPLLPPGRIAVFQTPRRPAGDPSAWRVQAAAIRELFLASLKPDIVHVSSLFEGLHDEATIAAGTPPTSVTIYDLIPFFNKDTYLKSEPVRAWYFDKIECLKSARLWLAISGNVRAQAIGALGLPEERVVKVASGFDECFVRQSVSPDREKQLRERLGLTRPFILYTSGIDVRKNNERLVEAFAMLPERRNFQLAIVCSATETERRALLAHAASAGLGFDEFVMTGFVSDADLVTLYNLCHLFVFPSLHEGFGLPALEAMACGAPVIGSAVTSIPEVIGRDDALFDPTRTSDIAGAMAAVLGDEGFRQELREHGIRQARIFSWDESARRVLAAFEQHGARMRDETGAATRHFLPGRTEWQVMIDITNLDLVTAGDAVKQLLGARQPGERLEAVFWDGHAFRYVTAATRRLLGLEEGGLAGEVAQAADGDSIVMLYGAEKLPMDARTALESFAKSGVDVCLPTGSA
jgi:glycosyltransferase involved in cell wall biosynthesis